MIAYSYTMVLKWFSNVFQRIPWYYIVYAQKNVDMCPKTRVSPLCIFKKHNHDIQNHGITMLCKQHGFTMVHVQKHGMNIVL